MADEVATMIARLDADMTRFEKNMNKALGIANTAAAKAAVETIFDLFRKSQDGGVFLDGEDTLWAQHRPQGTSNGHWRPA